MTSKEIRQKLGTWGESMIVAEGDNLIKVHIHAQRPGHVLDMAASWGTLHDIKCDNMVDQFHKNKEKQQDENLCRIDMRLAVKPVPSIKMSQASFNKRGEKCTLSVGGNHDICLFPRIVPVVEAMCYLVLADAFLVSKIERF